jgi:hypothetical protein
VHACETSGHGQWLPTTRSEWRGKATTGAAPSCHRSSLEQLQQQRPSCTHHRTSRQRNSGWTGRTGSPNAGCCCLARAATIKPRQARMCRDRGREVRPEEDSSRILLAQRLMRQIIKRLAGGSGESSALRWRQGCCCFSLLIRPCRCIKPNAQASRDPLTIRLPHLQTTHSSRDRTLHYLQPPLVPDCSPQTATRWHSSLTALKNPRPRLLSALSALQVALLSCKVLESPSSRQAGFRRQNPVSIHPARHVGDDAH